MPEKQLVPKAGTMERYRLMESLNFISTEVHKVFSPLFKPTTPDETKKTALDTLATRFEWLDKQLQDRDYLTGAQFTVADAYLFTVLSWARHVKLDLARWRAVQAFGERVDARPAVQAAMVAEGMLKA